MRDPAPLLEAIEASTDRRYRLVRPYLGGARGAWLVEDARGAEAVLKSVWDTDWRQRLDLASGVVARLRERGAPVPQFIAYGYEAGIGTWYLQDRVNGQPLSQLPSALLPQVLAFVDLAADLFSPHDGGWSWSADVVDALGPRSDRLALLRGSSSAVARLADSAADHQDAARTLTRADGVHGDLHTAQLMVDARGLLVAVIDWKAAAPGCRAIDVALLHQNVEVQTDRASIPADPAVIRGLAEYGLAVAGDGFVAAVHYHLVKMLAFVVAHNPRHVEWRLDIAQRVLRNLDGAMRGGG